MIARIFSPKKNSLLSVCLSVAACAVILLSAAGCRSGKESGGTPARDAAVLADEFPYVEVPSGMVNTADRVNWSADHFWDAFLKAGRLEKFFGQDGTQKTGVHEDTTVLGISGDVFEEAFANYIFILKNVRDYREARQSMEKLMRRAEALAVEDTASGFPADASLLTGLMRLGEKYLYDPQSPYMDDQLYLPVIRSVLNSGYLPDSIKLPYEYAYKIASLNMIGTKANNIKFATAAGGPLKNLYDIDAEFVLVYFNNPDCESCRRSLDILKRDMALADLVGSGRLKVLSVYPDSDLNMWEKERGHFPPDWIYAHDPLGELNRNTVYILRSIPSCYLLDKDKKVLLKDVNADRVIGELHSLAD